MNSEYHIEILMESISEVVHASVTLSSELSLACMQVPNGAQLFQDALRNEHLVNGFDKKQSSCSNSVGLSHSRIAKFLKLKWRKVECSVTQVGGAENIFYELFGKQDAGNTYWLDSSSTEVVLFLSRLL